MAGPRNCDGCPVVCPSGTIPGENTKQLLTGSSVTDDEGLKAEVRNLYHRLDEMRERLSHVERTTVSKELFTEHRSRVDEIFGEIRQQWTQLSASVQKNTWYVTSALGGLALFIFLIRAGVISLATGTPTP